MKIALIVGSIRPDRESIKPAEFIRGLLEKAGHQVTWLDLRELALPLFDSSDEQMALPAVRQFIAGITETDGCIAVFPEYNHTYGSAFKNALDFLRQREFMHRPLGLVSVSNGAIGGARATFAARGSLPTLGPILLPTNVLIPNMPAPFPTSQSCADEKVLGQITRLIQEMEVYAPLLAQARAQL